MTDELLPAIIVGFALAAVNVWQHYRFQKPTQSDSSGTSDRPAMDLADIRRIEEQLTLVVARRARRERQVR